MQLARKTKLGCTILEGNDIADLPIVSENSEILEDEILKNSKERHNHTNKKVLDNLSEDTEGSLQYKGEDVGKGDMTKAEYDADGDGKIDIANNSEKLDGQLPEYYARKKDVTDINNKVDIELKKKVDKVTGKQLSTNDYTDEEKQKLSGIEVGAEKNKVTSVNNKTGAVKITKSDVGLGNVDNIQQATKMEFNGHTGDTTKHITSTERNRWNAKGDMQKSVYDKDNNGIVDRAEKADSVNWSNVEGKPHVTNNEIKLGNYKLKYNSSVNSLDIEVI